MEGLGGRRARSDGDAGRGTRVEQLRPCLRLRRPGASVQPFPLESREERRGESNVVTRAHPSRLGLIFWRWCTSTKDAAVYCDPRSLWKSTPNTASTIPGLHTTGWVKRGPSGVIDTNKQAMRPRHGGSVDRRMVAGRLPHPKFVTERLWPHRSTSAAPRLSTRKAGWRSMRRNGRGDASAADLEFKLTDIKEMLDIAHMVIITAR